MFGDLPLKIGMVIVVVMMDLEMVMVMVMEMAIVMMMVGIKMMISQENIVNSFCFSCKWKNE